MSKDEAVLFTIVIPTIVEEDRLKNHGIQQSSESGGASAVQLSDKVENKSNEVPRIQFTASSSDLLEDLPLETPQELVVRQILSKFHIENVMWSLNVEGNQYHVQFSMDYDETYELLYETLQDWGIGDREGSSISVISCLVHKSSQGSRKETISAEQENYQQESEEPRTHSNYSRMPNAQQKHSAWTRFMNSVRSRLNVAQIVRNVRQDATITFDFCILLISAAILASFGLVENSTIFLASSMLISPLMGPIIAAIFGTVIEDRSLRRLGMINELIGILMATLVGFIFGLIVCTTDKRYGIGEGLTEEMLSRCDLHSLIVGIFTAIPSGAAAAIGILGGNIGSLVGVAISASLLPPAVNSGLLWAVACIYKYFENDDNLYRDVIKSRTYSDNQAKELAILGSISMCLTLSNVLCVYVMGILVLKVKEIAPVIGRKNSQFWKHDIKFARHGQGKDLTTEVDIIDEMLANLPQEDQQALGLKSEDFRRHLSVNDHHHQLTWSPLSDRHSFTTQPGTFSTIHRLEELYTKRINTTEDYPRQGPSLSRRSTQRGNELTVPMLPRPRFATMPSATSLIPKDFILEVPSKRFTVTPAFEN
ncbi:uncharacterized protein LOC6642167 isoform X1 [Drosophila willistoni]|uniref:uncharacterized protein LOC6642167 isoform X1 n=1 Tax=Drosophila willistoni TaxID=7260 RepID=UPI00017D7903|nr:uncharacterized protein LOC6642167 isoform X1 [Drosophila willistoni]